MANGALILIVGAVEIWRCRGRWLIRLCRPETKRKKNAGDDGKNRCADSAKQLRPIGNHQQSFHKSPFVKGENQYPTSAGTEQYISKSEILLMVIEQVTMPDVFQASAIFINVGASTLMNFRRNTLPLKSVGRGGKV